MSRLATLGALATITAESRSSHEYRAARTEWLEASFDCDTIYQGAALRSRPLTATVTGIGEARTAACEERGYWPDRHVLNRRAIACGGIAMDDEIATSHERRERPLFREVMRPLGLRSSLITVVTMRGEVLSSIYFGWTRKARPTARAIDAMRMRMRRRRDAWRGWRGGRRRDRPRARATTSPAQLIRDPARRRAKCSPCVTGSRCSSRSRVS